MRNSWRDKGGNTYTSEFMKISAAAILKRARSCLQRRPAAEYRGQCWRYYLKYMQQNAIYLLRTGPDEMYIIMELLKS